MKRTKVILSPEAEEVYSRLNKEATESKTEEKLLRGINKKVSVARKFSFSPVLMHTIP